jgi:AcrR family transcriptional regulator
MTVASEIEQLPIAADLPIAGQQPRRRADAMRNHERVLCTASRLFAERGPENCSMDLIASEAGVGKGTLFRRFGDRTNLFRTLIDDRERAFQEAFIRGPAPLGPGAPACERLIAFGHAMFELIEDHGPLLAASTPGTRALQYDHPVYVVYRTHVMTLVSELCGERRAPYLSVALLAALDPELVMYQRTLLGIGRGELEAGWAELITSLSIPSSPN